MALKALRAYYSTKEEALTKTLVKSGSTWKAVGKEMTEDLAAEEAKKKIKEKVKNNHYEMITTETPTSEAIISGKYKGGFKVTYVCTGYKEATSSTSSGQTANEISSEIQTVKDKAQNLISNIKNGTILKSATEKLNEEMKKLTENAEIQKLLKEGISKDNLKSIESLININIDSSLEKTLKEIEEKYTNSGNIGSTEYVNEKLNAIRSYKYALLKDPELKAELESKAQTALEDAISQGTNLITINGTKYVNELLNQYSPYLKEWQYKIDDEIAKVTKKTNAFMDFVSLNNETKIAKVLSSQIADALNGSKQISDAVSDLNAKLSKYGLSLPISNNVSGKIKDVADSIGKSTAKQLLPQIEKNQKQIQKVTNAIKTVQDAIAKAKKDVQEYIDKLKTMVNDFIARETAILTQEISKYIKLDLSGLTGGISL